MIMWPDVPASPVTRMVDEWLTMRAELFVQDEETRKRHPDITDTFGRIWVYDVYDELMHHKPCGLAWSEDMVRSGDFTLPTQAALDNPNYDLCAICLDGRERHVKVCNPAWWPDSPEGECPHDVCNRMRAGGTA